MLHHAQRMAAMLAGAAVTMSRQLGQPVRLEVHRGGQILLGRGESVPDLIAQQGRERPAAIDVGHMIDVTRRAGPPEWVARPPVPRRTGSHWPCPTAAHCRWRYR